MDECCFATALGVTIAMPTQTPAPATASASASAPDPSLTSTAQSTWAVKDTLAVAGSGYNSVKPFLWEIGDKTRGLAADLTDSGSGSAVYCASRPMAIALATKWLHPAYVAEKRAGALTADDAKFLNFQSGATNLDSFCS